MGENKLVNQALDKNLELGLNVNTPSNSEAGLGARKFR